MPAEPKHFDIGIVGGGPAALSAGVWSARNGRTVVLVDRGHPRNCESRRVNGYIGLPGVLPAELRARGRAECAEYGVHSMEHDVYRGRTSGNGALLRHLSGGATVGVLRLLIAIGVRDVWPDVPGLKHVYGANAHPCPDCDGYEALDKKLLLSAMADVRSAWR